jgi:hypothetical protein
VAKKKKPDTAGRVILSDRLAENAPRYVVGRQLGRLVIVVDGKVSDVQLTEQERERARHCDELIPVVVGELERFLTEGQPDDVREYRRRKLWQYGELMAELAGFRVGNATAINSRISARKAAKQTTTKAQEWHAIAFKLATPFWRDYPTGKPTTIARAIERQLNEELAALGWCKTPKTETIADYLRNNENQIKG